MRSKGLCHVISHGLKWPLQAKPTCRGQRWNSYLPFHLHHIVLCALALRLRPAGCSQFSHFLLLAFTSGDCAVKLLSTPHTLSSRMMNRLTCFVWIMDVGGFCFSPECWDHFAPLLSLLVPRSGLCHSGSGKWQKAESCLELADSLKNNPPLPPNGLGEWAAEGHVKQASNSLQV